MQVPSLKRKSSDGPQSSEPVGFKQPVTLTGSNAEQYVQLESALRKQIEVWLKTVKICCKIKYALDANFLSNYWNGYNNL